MGDTAENLRRAAKIINDCPGIDLTSASSIYLTEPVGYTQQPSFANAVIEVVTSFSPVELLGFCRSVEEAFGRERTIRWGPRVMDVDILLYDDKNIDQDDLIIPHPRMLERAFVMIPLAEIAPDVVLKNGLTAREASARIDCSGIEYLGTF